MKRCSRCEREIQEWATSCIECDDLEFGALPALGEDVSAPPVDAAAAPAPIATPDVATAAQLLPPSAPIAVSAVKQLAAPVTLPTVAAAAPLPEQSSAPLIWIVALLVAATLATAIALKVIKEGYVRSKFRRLLREVVRDSKFNLEKNPQLSVQIGKLLHIPEEPDQSVADEAAGASIGASKSSLVATAAAKSAASRS